MTEISLIVTLNTKFTDSLLASFDSSSGVGQMVQKLPYGFQGKWITDACKYKKTHNVAFPPFMFFGNFNKDMSTTIRQVLVRL